MNPHYYLTRCDLDLYRPHTCETNPLPHSSTRALVYEVMASHFFASFEIYSGSCEVLIYSENDPVDFLAIVLPVTPPCSIQDAEVLISITQTLLMVSDRKHGLFIYNIVVILPGYTFITLATEDLEDKYSLARLYSL